MTKEFLVIFEAGKSGFGAQAPDIPGCFAVGPTLEVTRQRYIEAAAEHLAWLASDRDPVPEPVTRSVDLKGEQGSEGSTFHTEWLAISMPAEAHKIPA